MAVGLLALLEASCYWVRGLGAWRLGCVCSPEWGWGEQRTRAAGPRDRRRGPGRLGGREGSSPPRLGGVLRNARVALTAAYGALGSLGRIGDGMDLGMRG